MIFCHIKVNANAHEHLSAQAINVVRVIEDCLNGRRTAWEDPYNPGRNGLVGVEQRIEINSPLAEAVLAARRSKRGQCAAT